MELVTIVVSLALLELLVFTFQVGTARQKAGINAPKMFGDDGLERAIRIQANTVEQYVIFIPAIYGFATFVNPTWAAGIGMVVVIGRILFCIGYKNPNGKRAPGFLMTFFPNVILVIGTIIGCALKLV